MDKREMLEITKNFNKKNKLNLKEQTPFDIKYKLSNFPKRKELSNLFDLIYSKHIELNTIYKTTINEINSKHILCKDFNNKDLYDFSSLELKIQIYNILELSKKQIYKIIEELDLENHKLKTYIIELKQINKKYDEIIKPSILFNI